MIARRHRNGNWSGWCGGFILRSSIRFSKPEVRVGDEGLADEVNRLYWESDASVGQIAERLGISRRALYDALTPWPADGVCPNCGAGLVYSNRSRRKADQPECPVCGLTLEEAEAKVQVEAEEIMRDRLEGELDAEFEADLEAVEADAASWAEPDPEFEQEWDAGRMAPFDTEEIVRRGRTLFIGAAALAGVVVGTLAVMLIRRR